MKKFYLVMGLFTAIFLLDITTVTANQQDILFVLDNSGSMHENKPDIITKLIFSAFITQLHMDDRVGIVIFDESARLTAPLTLLDNPTAREKLYDSLSKMNFLGQRTNTPAAIERAVYELHNNGRKDSQQSIVFLTDGIIDTGNTQNDTKMTKWLIEDLTTKCANLGIKIFGVAFTEEADFHLIQSLATNTKGAYFRIAKANDISKVFKEIIGLLTPPTNHTPETVAEPVDMTDKRVKLNTNITTVKIGKKESNSIFTSLLQSLSWTIIVVIMIAILSLFIYLVYRPKKTHPMKLVSAAPTEGDESQNLNPKAQLLGINETDTNNSEPPLLYFLDEHKITIGRDPQNVVVIPKETVSNFHATIQYINGHFQLEDNRSTNGTFVENSRLTPNQPVRLKHGDIVKFASFDFRFLCNDSAAAAETMMLTERLNRNYK